MADGLHTSVQRAVGDCPKTLSQLAQPLMVGAVHDHGVPVQTVQKTVGGIVYSMVLVGAQIAMAVSGGQILDDAAAQSHIDDLHSLTNAQNGKTALDAVFQSLQLQDIQLCVYGAGTVVMFAEKGGGDVAAAGKEQSLAGGQIADGQAGQVQNIVPFQKSLIISRVFFSPYDSDLHFLISTFRFLTNK